MPRQDGQAIYAENKEQGSGASVYRRHQVTVSVDIITAVTSLLKIVHLWLKISIPRAPTLTEAKSIHMQGCEKNKLY
jgi:hypothetical protein